MTELANRLKAKPLPRDVRVAAEKELRRLKRFVPPSLPSFFHSFSPISLLSSLPSFFLPHPLSLHSAVALLLFLLFYRTY